MELRDFSILLNSTVGTRTSCPGFIQNLACCGVSFQELWVSVNSDQNQSVAYIQQLEYSRGKVKDSKTTGLKAFGWVDPDQQLNCYLHSFLLAPTCPVEWGRRAWRAKVTDLEGQDKGSLISEEKGKIQVHLHLTPPMNTYPASFRTMAANGWRSPPTPSSALFYCWACTYRL